MATRATNQPSSASGIYLNAFFICQRIDGAPNGAITAHNISTSLTIHSTAPQMPPTQFNTPCIVTFTTDGGKQDYDVSVECQDPAGRTVQLFANQVQMSPGPGGGAMLANTIAIPVTQPGKYWLNLFIDTIMVSRLPLDFAYRQTAS